MKRDGDYFIDLILKDIKCIHACLNRFVDEIENKKMVLGLTLL